MSKDADISGHAIRSELERVLQSDDFAASEQLTCFLRFVVEESLDGRGPHLKERNIAIKALGRDRDFDPRQDSIVRVVAGKLRRSLERYYATTGGEHELQIDMPKGSYCPAFRAPAEPTLENGGVAISPSEATRPVDGLPRKHRRLVLLSVGLIGLAAAVISGAFWLPKFWPRDADPEIPEPVTPPKSVVQAGALPYRLQGSETEVLLVRTRRDSHWTIPKVTFAGNASMWELAATEAYNEAGVQGEAVRLAIGDYVYQRKGRSYRVVVYPVLVTEEVSSWPEDKRTRRWYKIDSAAETVESGALRQLLRSFHPD